MNVYFGWRTNAGLVCICIGDWAIHLFVQPSCWCWGIGKLWHYDGAPAREVGLGPIFLAAYMQTE